MSMFTKTAPVSRTHRRSRGIRAKGMFTGRDILLGGAFHEVPGKPGVLEDKITGIQLRITGYQTKPYVKKLHNARWRRAAKQQLEVINVTIAGHNASAMLEAAAVEQIQLYKPVVIDRVLGRFETAEQAEEWFETGSVPGFADDTPRGLVAQGHADWVIHAIDAIEAGVHA